MASVNDNGANSTYDIGNYLNLYESYLIRNNIVPYNDKEEYIRFLTRFILHHGYLRGSIKKIAAFLTKKVMPIPIDDSVKDKINSIFSDLDYLTIEFNTLFNMFIFDYTALMYFPKQKVGLKCPKCENEYDINKSYPYTFKLVYLDEQYHDQGKIRRLSKLPKEEKNNYAKVVGIQSVCPKCGTEHSSQPTITWDKADNGKIKLLNPLWYDIFHNDVGNKYLRITPDYYDGSLDLDTPLRYMNIEGLSWDVICCFAAKDRYFLPDKQYYQIFSMEEISSLGSGRSVSALISSLSDLLHIDILKLGNEGIALSKVNPLYVLSPTDPTGNGSFGLIDQEEYKDFFLQEVKEHQQGDINRMIYSPIPINAQPMFGDGKRFMAMQELMHIQSNVITALGYSPDVLNGTTGIINEPFNLSSMEILMEGVQSKYSDFLTNILKLRLPNYTKEAKESKYQGKLFVMEKISLAKGGLDYNTKIDLVRQGILPMSTLIEDMGYPDMRYWEEVMTKESASKYKADIKLNQRMSRIDQNAMMAAQDNQVSTGQIDTTAAEAQLNNRADQHIEILANMPDSGQRKSYFNQIKNEDPTLYYIVIGKWEDYQQYSNTQMKYQEGGM